MNAQTVNLYSLTYRESRSYLFAALFIVGNIVLPQLCHLVPQGGLMLLPIYFFTLIGAYKYGWQVGLATALLSPLVNSLLFGMPPAASLPGIMVKSVLLALAAAYIAHRYQKVSIPLLLAVVLNRKLPGRTVVRTAVFSPYVLSGVGVANAVSGAFYSYVPHGWSDARSARLCYRPLPA